MQKGRLDKSQARIKTPRSSINNLRYVEDTTPLAESESEEELKSLLMRVKEESKNASFKLNTKKQRSWHSGPSLHGKQKGEK